MKNKVRLFKIGLVIFLALVLVGIALYVAAVIHHKLNTVVICGEEYDRSVSAVDLSGKPLSGEIDSLLQFSHLQYADLTDTGITPEQYDALHAAVSDCDIRWSVPVGNSFYPSDISTLTLTPDISPSDIHMIGYLTNLKTLDAREYPLCDELYDLTFQNGEKSVGYDILLHETLYGTEITEQTEKLDFSHTKITDLSEFYQKLRFFTNIKKIYVGDIAIPDEEMDALNKAFPATKIVWLVEFSIWQVRTDIKVFSTQVGKLQKVKVRQDQIQPLVKYCTDLEALDLGHNLMTDVSCLAGLKNIDILIISSNRLSDISVLRNFPKIHFLDIRNQPKIDDLSPIASLPELEQIELQHLGKVENMSAFMHCPKLKMLFALDVDFTDCTLDDLKAACPECLFDMESDFTKHVWANTDKNMIIRDLFTNWARVDTETYNGWDDVRFTEKPTCGWKYKDRYTYY